MRQTDRVKILYNVMDTMVSYDNVLAILKVIEPWEEHQFNFSYHLFVLTHCFWVGVDEPIASKTARQEAPVQVPKFKSKPGLTFLEVLLSPL